MPDGGADKAAARLGIGNTMNINAAIFILVAALIGVRLFLRVRRAIGRQRLNARRLKIRLAILTVFGLLVLAAASRTAVLLAALLGGGACGVALGYLALRHTRIDATPAGRFYTPHTYIGLSVTAVFLIGMVYDYFNAYHQLAAASAGGTPATTLPPESPLTIALSGVFIAYYAAYSLGLLRRGKSMAATAAAGP